MDFRFYVVSIVANLPLIFVMVSVFPIKMIITLVIIAVIIRISSATKTCSYLYKESRAVFLLCGLLALNLATSCLTFQSPPFGEKLCLSGQCFHIDHLQLLINRVQIIRYGFVTGLCLSFSRWQLSSSMAITIFRSGGSGRQGCT